MGSKDIKNRVREAKRKAIFAKNIAIGAIILALLLAAGAFGWLGSLQRDDSVAVLRQDLEAPCDALECNSIEADTVRTQIICPEDITHVVDGLLDPDHEVQYLGGTGVKIMVPADLSNLKSKTFSLYSIVNNSTHILEIQEGGASWDKYHEFRYLRIEPSLGSGVKFMVIDDMEITVISSSGALRCLTPSPETCVPLDLVPYTYGVVAPPGGPTPGAFRWPDANLTQVYTRLPPGPGGKKKRSITPQLPIFPYVFGAGEFPPPSSVQFESGTAALNALAGTTIYNTTVFFEPGEYEENLIISGMQSITNRAGTLFEEGPRDSVGHGLRIVGDPRLLAGATYYDCITTFSANFFEILTNDGGTEPLFGTNVNSIVAVSADTFRIDNCGSDKSMCETDDAVKVSVSGYGAGDKVVIYSIGDGERFEVPIVSVSPNNDVQVDLSSVSITDLLDVFPLSPTPDQCGSSVTFMPNRIIKGEALPSDGTSVNPIGALTVNSDVQLIGFWIQGVNDFGEGAYVTSYITANLIIRNCVFDSLLLGEAFGLSPSLAANIIVDGGAIITDTFAQEFGKNLTISPSPGSSSSNEAETLPLTFMGGFQGSSDSFAGLIGVDAQSHIAVNSLHFVAGLDVDIISQGGKISVVDQIVTNADIDSPLDITLSSLVYIRKMVAFKGRVPGASAGSRITIQSFENYDIGGSLLSNSESGGVVHVGDLEWQGSFTVDLINSFQTFPEATVLIDTIEGDVNIICIGAHGSGTMTIGRSKCTGVIDPPSSFMDLRFDRFSLDGAPAGLTFPCNTGEDYQWESKTFHIYNADTTARSITFSGCPFTTPYGATADIAGAVGDGFSFTFVGGQFIELNNVNVT